MEGRNTGVFLRSAPRARVRSRYGGKKHYGAIAEEPSSSREGLLPILVYYAVCDFLT